MKIQFYNCPPSESFDQSLVQEKPNFLAYHPDFALMNKLAQRFADKKQIVVIGHGGSVTTFKGIYYALQGQANKEALFITTVDPDTIARIKAQTNPEHTLVIAISKSGETVTQLEALMQFTEYPLLFITGVAGPLAEIAHRLNATMVVHPPIGGRFTGLTEVALLPAALCGFDVKSLYDAGVKWYEQFGQNNPAYEAASIFNQIEAKGITEVFMPVYTDALFMFTNLIVQLCHESFGKEQKGQTYFAHKAPESQHHTNQRFFGGRHNIAGWFMSAQQSANPLVTTVPETLANIPLKDHTLQSLNNIPLHKALQYEREGTIEDAKLSGIPFADMQFESCNEKAAGELVAFFQLYAVYGSLLRKVNPFDQLQVENSKKISFSKRLSFSGEL